MASWMWPCLSEQINQGYHEGHPAIDIDLVTNGEPIRAAVGGNVVYAQWSSAGYGYLIIIESPNNTGIKPEQKTLKTYYGHLQAFEVSTGMKVKKGQVIGYGDDTGNSTGPHLHFEIRAGSWKLNPLEVFGKVGTEPNTGGGNAAPPPGTPMPPGTTGTGTPPGTTGGYPTIGKFDLSDEFDEITQSISDWFYNLPWYDIGGFAFGIVIVIIGLVAITSEYQKQIGSAVVGTVKAVKEVAG